MSTYVGGEQLSAAQRTLEEHTISSATGLCLSCRIPGPCAAREYAGWVFARAARLPVRVPGLSRPELVGARRLDAVAVFSSAG
jgi:hypothetical protein